MPDIFVSYSHTDKDIAVALEAGLTAAGWAVWRDETRLQAGARFGPEIESAISSARCVVACLSPAALASDWVRAEMGAGKARLVPVKVRAIGPLPIELQALIGGLHIGDLTSWVSSGDATAWRAFIQACERTIGKPMASASVPQPPPMPAAGAPVPQVTTHVNLLGTARDVNIISNVQGDLNING